MMVARDEFIWAARPAGLVWAWGGPGGAVVVVDGGGAAAVVVVGATVVDVDVVGRRWAAAVDDGEDRPPQAPVSNATATKTARQR